MSRTETSPKTGNVTSRKELVGLLNEDLAREYQAIISYVVYSQVLKGAEYMNIAAELEKHAQEELSHALIIARQIDYLGGMPAIQPKQVRTSEEAKEMLRFDLENETETIRNYRERVRQCDALGEFAMAEHIREILIQEQDHQIIWRPPSASMCPIPRVIHDLLRVFVRSPIVPRVQFSPPEAISSPAPGRNGLSFLSSFRF